MWLKAEFSAAITPSEIILKLSLHSRVKVTLCLLNILCKDTAPHKSQIKFCLLCVEVRSRIGV